MKKLNLKDNIKNYIYDLDDYISIYGNNIYIFNYASLDMINNNKIEIHFINKKIIIKSKDLIIKKMTKQELLINGYPLEIEFIYE